MVCNWRLLPEEGFDAENVTIALCFRFECAQDAERIVEDTTEKASFEEDGDKQEKWSEFSGRIAAAAIVIAIDRREREESTSKISQKNPLHYFTPNTGSETTKK